MLVYQRVLSGYLNIDDYQLVGWLVPIRSCLMPIKAGGDKDQIWMKLLHETDGQIWISSVFEPRQHCGN